MCLAAIYWAHIDKIYYGNNQHDAAGIGFDDSFIYREIRLPAKERQLPSERLLNEEAIRTFERWREKPDKTEY